MNQRLVSFVAGGSGPWAVTAQSAWRGQAMPAASFISVHAGSPYTGASTWVLHGSMSNERYVTALERSRLAKVQQGLGRAEAVHAAMIPIRKSPQWWALAQDERRHIFEEQSRHIEVGMKYLPPIARRLHHCRDLADEQPFDFITWFEYAPEHEAAFDDMLCELRASPEWQYVEREIDIRMTRVSAAR